MSSLQIERLCHTRRSGWEGLSGGQVEGLVEAERLALGQGSVELLLAEVCAYQVEAVLPVACFKLLPRLSRTVQEGLRDAVQHGRPVPVAGVGGQGRQAEAGVGDTVMVP